MLYGQLYVPKQVICVLYIFNCYCNKNCLRLPYKHSINSEYGPINFFILRCLKKDQIKKTLYYTSLSAQAQKKELLEKNDIPTNEARYDLLQPLQVYQNVKTGQFKNIPLTNLIIH